MVQESLSQTSQYMGILSFRAFGYENVFIFITWLHYSHSYAEAYIDFSGEINMI